ncbi:hypothetical protein JGU66_29140 [Myxococcaceae bacterium JPH2]|nr:hypothetical protein [Myxococcaceae bacterium JPH2]
MRDGHPVTHRVHPFNVLDEGHSHPEALAEVRACLAHDSTASFVPVRDEPRPACSKSPSAMGRGVRDAAPR